MAETMGRIVDLQITRIADRIDATYGASVEVTPAARDKLVAAAQTGDAGARAIETMLARTLLPRIADLFLNSVVDGMVPRSHRDRCHLRHGRFFCRRRRPEEAPCKLKDRPPLAFFRPINVLPDPIFY